MLKIKLIISDCVTLSGLFYDAQQNKCSINRTFQCEENALDCVNEMRDRDCEFSLVIMRKA